MAIFKQASPLPIARSVVSQGLEDAPVAPSMPQFPVFDAKENFSKKVVDRFYENNMHKVDEKVLNGLCASLERILKNELSELKDF